MPSCLKVIFIDEYKNPLNYIVHDNLIVFKNCGTLSILLRKTSSGSMAEDVEKLLNCLLNVSIGLAKLAFSSIVGIKE